MIHIIYISMCLSAGLTVSSSLWILDQRSDCSHQCPGCIIKNCSGEHVDVDRAPQGPEWSPNYVEFAVDKRGAVPVMKVMWMLKSDAGVKSVRGSEVDILDESTNQSICAQFSYRIHDQLKPNDERWTFHLDAVVVQPGRTYMASVINLPEPKSGTYRIKKQITVPGCDDGRIKMAQICLENGSLWEPDVSTDVSVNKKHKKLFIRVCFQAAQYSEIYQVSLHGGDLYYSKNLSKGENDTSLNVTLEFGLWQLSQCEMILSIQPFFIRCKSNCQRHRKVISYCADFTLRTLITKAVLAPLVIVNCCIFYLMWRSSHKGSGKTSPSAATDQPSSFQVKERTRVLIIYSLDHPLYKNVVLKLCGFLAAKCGTEVVLDLLDSARLGVLGSIQWLDWQREQIESSSDKVLILCSPGVQAKWRAMCGAKPVLLKQDVDSPVGDMLTPALCLLVPHFIRSASFEKYIVAYFDGVCSEDDVPSPFNITVRYKLMEQFEELVFRIMDTEKHEPGRVHHIEGLAEGEYDRCPSGRALQCALEAFQAHQLKHPQWFQDELQESSQVKVEEPSATLLYEGISFDSTQVLLSAYSGGQNIHHQLSTVSAGHVIE